MGTRDRIDAVELYKAKSLYQVEQMLTMRGPLRRVGQGMAVKKHAPCRAVRQCEGSQGRR